MAAVLQEMGVVPHDQAVAPVSRGQILDLDAGDALEDFKRSTGVGAQRNDIRFHLRSGIGKPAKQQSGHHHEAVDRTAIAPCQFRVLTAEVEPFADQRPIPLLLELLMPVTGYDQVSALRASVQPIGDGLLARRGEIMALGVC